MPARERPLAALTRWHRWRQEPDGSFEGARDPHGVYGTCPVIKPVGIKRFANNPDCWQAPP